MIALVVVGVRIHVHAGIPEGTAVGHIVQYAARKYVGVNACCSIHGVSASCRESDRLPTVSVVRIYVYVRSLPACQSSLPRPRCMLHQMHAH